MSETMSPPKLAEKIEKQIKLYASLGPFRLTLAPDAAAALVEMLRATDALVNEVDSLRAKLASAESIIDLLESNARVQAKLLADTGRERDRLLAREARA